MMRAIRSSYAILAATVAAIAGVETRKTFGTNLPPADLTKVFQGRRFVKREPKVKSRGARISVAENKRRSKKKKNIKRARRLGHYTRPGRQAW